MRKNPNILLLCGEDAGRALSCYGDPDAKTPSLDRLAEEGCRFDNAFTTSPVCSPSRATMVTGHYPWSLGTHHHRSQLIQPPQLFTHELRKAGYYVNWSSKTDFNFQPDEDFADDTEHKWIEELEKGVFPEQPFFLFNNFAVTHESTMWDDEETRCGGCHKERVTKTALLKPEQRVDPSQVHVPAYLPDTPAVRADIARFYEAQSIADYEIGRVLEALDASEHKDNTIVIYLTDHGRGLPREKRWCYDAGLHLSLIIRAPGVTTAGTVSEDLISWVDLAPTILSLAGVEIPKHYQGQIFLGPDSAAPRDYVFGGRDRMDEGFDHCRTARNKDYLYISNAFPEIPYSQRLWYFELMGTAQALRQMAEAGSLLGSDALFMQTQKPSEELYDVHVDPEMVHNLAGEPALGAVKAELREALKQNQAKWGDLGLKPERQLISQGIITDCLDQMRAKVEKLPVGQRIGVEQTIVEMPVG